MKHYFIKNKTEGKFSITSSEMPTKKVYEESSKEITSVQFPRESLNRDEVNVDCKSLLCISTEF